MRIAVGSDHGGFPLNKRIVETLERAGHDVIDFGAHTGDQPDDYPDYARLVGECLQRGEAERAILLCGSGVGVAVAANKLRGVRACLCHDTYSARQGVEHDDMNVLVMGSRVIGVELARDLAKAFLDAKFSGEERHRRRLEKLRALERGSTP